MNTGNKRKKIKPYNIFYEASLDWICECVKNNDYGDNDDIIEENNPICYTWWQMTMDFNPDNYWKDYK